MANAPRVVIYPTGKPGGWFNLEDFFNELTVQILNSNSVKALSVAIVDSSGAIVNPLTTSTATATLSNVAGSASSVTLLASNTSRKGAIIFNDSSAILYVKFGATASTSSFTYRVNPYNTLELKPVVYTGVIDGIFASATGNARVTELT